MKICLRSSTNFDGMASTLFKTVVYTVPIEKRKSRLDKVMGNIDRMIEAQNISFAEPVAVAASENHHQYID
jgi:hypothetical protein